MNLESTSLRDDEIKGLLAPLARYDALVLAVSGGADSVALMNIVSRWRALHSDVATRVCVVTVDHGLRAESSAEARWVCTLAQSLGFDHDTLVWAGEKPETGIQDAARAARYGLLLEHAEQFSDGMLVAVVTAHHLDDQVETFLMRLARGSGLDGLSGIAVVREAGSCEIVRPLLSVPKTRLVATLRSAGLDWIEDPSNSLLEFERVRVRQAGDALRDLGLEPQRVAESVRRLQASRAALDFATTEFARSIGLELHGGAFASVPLDKLIAAPGDLGVRLLARVLKAYGGQSEPPRLAKIEVLFERLQTQTWRGATLGGCQLSRSGPSLRIYRESGREEGEETPLDPGAEAVWDRRFVVGLGYEGTASAQVRRLGKQGYAAIRTSLSGRSVVPAAAAETLPAFWRGETLLAVPPLAYVADGCGKTSFKAEFVGL